MATKSKVEINGEVYDLMDAQARTDAESAAQVASYASDKADEVGTAVGALEETIGAMTNTLSPGAFITSNFSSFNASQGVESTAFTTGNGTNRRWALGTQSPIGSVSSVTFTKVGLTIGTGGGGNSVTTTATQFFAVEMTKEYFIERGGNENAWNALIKKTETAYSFVFVRDVLYGVRAVFNYAPAYDSIVISLFGAATSELDATGGGSYTLIIPW